MVGRVSLFVLSLAVFCAIQLKLHVCEDALTRKLEVICRGGQTSFLATRPACSRGVDDQRRNGLTGTAYQNRGLVDDGRLFLSHGR